MTLLGYALDTFPQGFAKGDIQNALDGLEWGASCVSETSRHVTLSSHKSHITFPNRLLSRPAVLTLPRGWSRLCEFPLQPGLCRMFASSATHPGYDGSHRYLVAAHSAPNQFVAVVGNSTLDFNYYGPVRTLPLVYSCWPALEGSPLMRSSAEMSAGIVAQPCLIDNTCS